MTLVEKEGKNEMVELSMLTVYHLSMLSYGDTLKSYLACGGHLKSAVKEFLRKK